MQQTPIHTSKISNDLVTRALNYHGQQLTSFFKETPVFHDLDLKNVDYHLYHQRSKELRMEDRGKRLLLHRYTCFYVIHSNLLNNNFLDLSHKTHKSCSKRIHARSLPSSATAWDWTTTKRRSSLPSFLPTKCLLTCTRMIDAGTSLT